MPAALTLQLVQLILGLLPYIPKLVEDLKQSGELTKDQEAALDASIESHRTDPSWQVDD